LDISHLICENEDWWRKTFNDNGWTIEKDTNHVSGLKDNWQSESEEFGNRVFVLTK
jgi:hypothetical protein